MKPATLGYLDALGLSAQQCEVDAAVLADAVGLEPELLRAHTRDRVSTRQRHAVYWCLHALGWSYSEIGRAIDRDHSSIMHACRKVSRAAAESGALSRRLAGLVLRAQREREQLGGEPVRKVTPEGSEPGNGGVQHSVTYHGLGVTSRDR